MEHSKLPRRAAEQLSGGCNPRACIKQSAELSVEKCRALAEALIRVESKDAHWSASAFDAIVAAMMWEAKAKVTED